MATLRRTLLDSLLILLRAVFQAVPMHQGGPHVCLYVIRDSQTLQFSFQGCQSPDSNLSLTGGASFVTDG